MTTYTAQWWGGSRIPPPPGQASLGIPIYLHYVRETPKITVSACRVADPQLAPGLGQGMWPRPCGQCIGWGARAGSLDLLLGQVCLEMVV